MTRNPLHQTRRQFLQRGLQTSAGVAAAAMMSSPCWAAAAARFELSIHQYSLKKLFDEGQIDIATYAGFVKEQFGITNVEFAAEFCAPLREDPAKAEAIRVHSEKIGVHNRVFLCDNQHALDSSNPESQKAAIKDHLVWANVAEKLGCDFIRVRASTDGDQRKQLDHAAQGIGALCDALTDSSLSVLIENVGGFSRRPDWIVDLVERIGKERVGLIADFGNFEGDLYDGMTRLMPYTKSVCTKSWEFDDQGNETKIDFARMMKIVKASNFQGCIAIEYLGKEPIAGVKQTAALIKRHMQ